VEIYSQCSNWNYQPFWEKPPLFFWLRSGEYESFGINKSFAARLPNAITGIVTLLTFSSQCKRLAAVNTPDFYGLYACSVPSLPHLYFKSGINLTHRF
jgi:4-amino-4-deoxy-L-arabinose transferase-like glycosyltransferase